MLAVMSRIAATVAIVAIACSALPASAEERSFAKVGRWSITAVTNGTKFAYCAADIDNGKVQLRLAMDGKSWRVGVPYYGSKKKVDGFYGFGDAAESASFTVRDGSWAYLSINEDQLNAFETLPEFAINLDRGLQTWKLAGSADALLKAFDCAQELSAKPVASVVPSPNAAKDCPPVSKYRSQNSNRAVNVTFYNGSKFPVTIYWIGFDGNWKKYHTLKPDTNVVQKTFATHPWIATDPRGNCYNQVFLPDPSGDAETNNFQVNF